MQCLKVTPEWKIEIVEVNDSTDETVSETPNLAATLLRAVAEGRMSFGDAYFPIYDLALLAPLLLS